MTRCGFFLGAHIDSSLEKKQSTNVAAFFHIITINIQK